jgi:hypothetical protein
MKLLVSILTGLALFAVSHNAIAYDIVTVLSGGTNNVAAASSNLLSLSSIPVGKYNNIAITFGGATLAGATSNIWVYFDASVDNAHWASNKYVVLAPTSGTSTNYVVTNITENAFQYLRVASIYNTNTAQLTNIWLSIGGQPGL